MKRVSCHFERFKKFRISDELCRVIQASRERAQAYIRVFAKNNSLLQLQERKLFFDNKGQ